MQDHEKTKADLLQELAELRREVVRLKTVEAECVELKQQESLGRDTTERRQVEEALRESEEKYRTILENVADGYYEVDLAGNLTFFTDSLCQILGYPKDEMMGMNNRDYSDPENAEKLYKIFNKVYQTRKLVKRFAWEVTRKDGTTAYVEASVSLITDVADQPVGFRGVVRDITERKQAEDALRKQATELATVAQVSIAAATILETDRLLQEAVDLTKSSFNLYHAHIYLLNDAGDTLILAAGAGEVGRHMVAKGWSIPFEQKQSLVARAARTQQGVVVNNVYEVPDWLPNPLLPNTRSELAVPIVVGDTLLGVLDVQADVVDRFTNEDVRAKTTLAAQVAVALQNARSFERAEQAITDLDALTRRLTREGWQGYLDTVTTSEIGYIYDLDQLASIRRDDAHPVGTTEPALTKPLTVHGEIIGHLMLAEPQTLRNEAAEIVNAVTERLSTHIENLRLSEQTERILTETEALYAGSERLVRTSNTEDILLALVESTAIQQFDRANIMFFDKAWDETPPNEMTVAVVWERSGQPSRAPAGTRYLLKEMPFAVLVDQNKPTFVPDISMDERVDKKTRAALEQLGMQSIAVFPLVAGGLRIGIVTVQSGISVELPEEQIRQISSLVDQAATVIQNQRLFQQAQAALAEVERLAAIVENHPDFIGVGTLDDKALYVNPAGLRMMELPPDHDVTTMDARDFFPPEDVKMLFEEGIPAALEKGFWSAEANLLRVDGTTIPVEQTVGINYDVDGKPYSFSITMRDITERKQAEEALRVSQERFALAVQGSNDGIWDWDIVNGTLYWSPRLKELLGYSPDELDEDFDIFESRLHPDDEEYVNAALQAHLKERVPYDVEERMRTKTGEYRWFRARGQAIWDKNGNAIRMTGSTTDITEQKTAETERERLLAEVEATYRQHVRQEWGQFLGEQHQGNWRIEHQRAGLAGEQDGNGTEEQSNIQHPKSKIEAPISLRGQTIGTLSLQDIDPDRKWTDEERALVEAVSEQLALTVENLRLLDNTQQRATREQLTRQIADKMRALPDVDSIIQVGVQELAKVLGGSHTVIELNVEPDDQ